MKLFLISMMGTVVLLFFNHFHRLIVMLCFRRAFSLHKVLFVRTFLLQKNTTALHGHGIAVVRKIVDKHNGIISFEHTDDMFRVEAALPVI